MPKCTHRGCEKQFNDAENTDKACVYHSGAPIFHEGLKGWQCCSKRVIDFDDFLKIPGCTTGKHSTEPIAVPEQKKEESATSTPVPTSNDNGKETYGTTEPTPVAAPIPIPTTAPAASPVETPELNDDPDAIIPQGTKCKRSSCNSEYKDESSRSEKCIHHPGTAVFHEGSKGWSCCSRKVLEFDEFLKIPGCTESKHMFIGPKSKDDLAIVNVRNDFYQTQTHVIVSFFAKKIDKTKSIIKFSENTLDLDIYFTQPTPNGPQAARHSSTKDLFQPIDPESSSFNILGTKVEIKLAKANGISWPALTVQEAATGNHGMVTFGVTGGGGTVGGKEMYLQSDSALYAKR